MTEEIQSNVPKRGNLSSYFMGRLKKGLYAKILEYILQDHQLDIQLRDNYINVYYRGGNILRIRPKSYNFDKFYFYNGAFPKSYIENVAKDKEEIPTNTKLPKPSKKEADAILETLGSKQAALMDLLSSDINKYFDSAKQVMDNWFDCWHKQERDDQHYIALSNVKFDEHSDLVVVDLEFAVSSRHPYNHAKNKNDNIKVCRFDIIAVDKTGQIYVIELKQNEDADSENNNANINVHKTDFDETIGCDSAQSFANEIDNIVKVKQNLGILNHDVFVDLSKKPLFAVAYSGEDADTFNEKYEKADFPIIKIVSKGKTKKLKFK